MRAIGRLTKNGNATFLLALALKSDLFPLQPQHRSRSRSNARHVLTAPGCRAVPCHFQISPADLFLPRKNRCKPPSKWQRRSVLTSPFIYVRLPRECMGKLAACPTVADVLKLL